MANSKRMYSKLAEYYNGFVVPNSIDDKRRYEKTKNAKENITSAGNSTRST